jgi:hypothetical protein
VPLLSRRPAMAARGEEAKMTVRTAPAERLRSVRDAAAQLAEPAVRGIGR